MNTLEVTVRFFIAVGLLALEGKCSAYGTSSLCASRRSYTRSQWVSYRQTFRGGFLFRKIKTRINYRWEYDTAWKYIDVCCPGYERVSTTNPARECEPVCQSNCIGGECIAPNLCSCRTSYRSVVKDGVSGCEPYCGPKACGDHGTCVGPDSCSCDVGYVSSTFENSKSEKIVDCVARCSTPCGKNAFCASPDVCACRAGYVRSQLTNVGVDCQPSCSPKCGENANCVEPDVCRCNDGYLSVAKKCIPICDHRCIAGTCTRPNYCDCDDGYEKKSADLPYVCSPICHPTCVNGNCARPFECECNEGYEKNSTDSSHVCSPTCDLTCGNKARCVGPNECACENGWAIVGGGTTSSTLTSGSSGMMEKFMADGENNCRPVCEPQCRKNEICVGPNDCQCVTGYREEIVEVNVTECRPICEGGCVNGYCGFPNECVCWSGYEKKSIVDRSVCEQICRYGCFNGNCTRPDVCECHEGFEKSSSKIITTTETPERRNFSDNTCVPVCPGQCLNGSCIGPDRCVCDEGYVLKNRSTIFQSSTEVTTNYDERETGNSVEYVEFCEPICGFGCEIGSDCRSTDDCESTVDVGRGSRSTDSTPGVSGDFGNDCGNNGEFSEKIGKCVCGFGWTGSTCEESSFCGLVFEPIFKDDGITAVTVQSIVGLSNETVESTYDVSNDVTTTSGYSESRHFVEWEGPMCLEECRIFMTSSVIINGNKSDEATANCYLLESKNGTSGVLYIGDQVPLRESENVTVVCFVSIQSQCNVPKLKIVRRTFEGLIGGIVGVIVLLAISTIAGLAIYRRRKKTFELTPTVSMSNDAMLLPPESMYPMQISEENSFT